MTTRESDTEAYVGQALGRKFHCHRPPDRDSAGNLKLAAGSRLGPSQSTVVGPAATETEGAESGRRLGVDSQAAR